MWIDMFQNIYLRDAMLPIMEQTANSVGLGLLIIDELQHLDKNFKSVMNYFVALMNSFECLYY